MLLLSRAVEMRAGVISQLSAGSELADTDTAGSSRSDTSAANDLDIT
jgi:hypothetical protein